MAKEVKIKTSGLNITTIPEVIGNLKVKDNPLVPPTNITSLYAKTTAGSTSAELVWQIPTATENPTQPGGPCDGYLPCNVGTFVHYPANTIGASPRWNCSVWQNTGQTVNLNLIHELADPEYSGVPEVESPFYARIYDFVESPPPLPPPPSYVLAELTTFTIADRFVFFINSKNTKSAAAWHTQTNIPIFPQTNNTIFDTRHGVQSGTYYLNNSLCNSLFSTICPCDSATGCEPITPNPTTQPICTCSATTCFITGVQINQSGEAGPDCLSPSDFIQQTNVYPLIDTGCTSDDCESYPNSYTCSVGSCYGLPRTSPSGDDSPSAFYNKRLVGKLPQYLFNYEKGEENNSSFVNVSAMADSLPKFTDFSFLSMAGCDPQQCNDPVNGCGVTSGTSPCLDNFGRCPSAWYTKIFTPFYVNIPNFTDPTTGTNIDLRGRYIKFYKKRLNLWVDNQYDNNNLLKELTLLMSGRKKACGIVLGIPLNTQDPSSPDYNNVGTTILAGPPATETMTSRWGLFEFPMPLTAGGLSQTHQVVIEVRNPGDNNCQACINTGVPIIPGQMNCCVSIEYIGLYPLTDRNGLANQPFRSWFANGLNSNFAPAASFGINKLKSYRYGRIPSINDKVGWYIDTAAAATAISTNSDDGSLNNTAIYTDNYDFTNGTIAGTTTSGNTNSVRYTDMMNLFNQTEIQITQATNCLCEII